MTTDNIQRIEHLEFLVTHLQKLYEELNKVVFRQQSELDALRNHFVRLDVGYQSLVESERTPRTLADDRPPHY
ncbi:SlyX family protein [Pirellulaceae bacterium SH467]